MATYLPARSKKSLFQWIDFVVLVTFPLLIRLPAAFGLQNDIRARLLCLVPIMFVIWRRLAIFLMAKQPLVLSAHKFSPLYLLYILLLAVAFLRTMLGDSVEVSRTMGNLLILVLAQAFIFALASQAKKPGEELKKGIYLSWVVYIGANLIMELLNITAREEIFTVQQISKLGSYLGLQVFRTTFPTATGINTFGNVAGVLLIGSFFVARDRRFNALLRATAVFGVLASLVSLVFTDSRAATIFAVVAIALSYVPYPFSRVLRLMPIVSVAFPILLVIMLNTMPTSVIQLISRNAGHQDALTLSNRTIIWDAGLKTLQEAPDQMYFGYGYRGQIAAGAVEKYQYLFGSHKEVTALSLHNSYLQTVFESGMVGAVLLVTILTILFVILDRDRQESRSLWTNVLYFTLIFFTFVSSTDSILTFDNQESYITFLFIATVAFFSLSAGRDSAEAQQKSTQVKIDLVDS